jgi:hypothetical protein
MFLLELDVSLYFVPPMAERARGIVVTRTLELPFPPTDGLFITGVAMNGQPLAEGFKIEDVTWDLDRQRFLGSTSLTSHDFPIAEIPDLIRAWINRGWRLGSYEDTYEEEAEEKADILLTESVTDEPIENEEEANRWPMLNPRSRSPAFNMFLQALAREMARLYNNWDVAYAIYQTKTFFTEKQLEDNKSRAATKFRDARSKFDGMTFDQQYDWREKLLRKRPRLRRITAKKA